MIPARNGSIAGLNGSGAKHFNIADSIGFAEPERLSFAAQNIFCHPAECRTCHY